jgi:hypothetical protein
MKQLIVMDQLWHLVRLAVADSTGREIISTSATTSHGVIHTCLGRSVERTNGGINQDALSSNQVALPSKAAGGSRGGCGYSQLGRGYSQLVQKGRY